MRSPAAVLSVALLAVVFAGCGSDDEDSPSTEQAEVPLLNDSSDGGGSTAQTKTPRKARLLRSDREAEIAVRTAATAVETLAAQEGGSYAGVTASELRSVDPTIPPTVAFRAVGPTSFSVGIQSEVSGTSFAINKQGGEYAYTCSAPGEGDCPEDADWAP